MTRLANRREEAEARENRDIRRPRREEIETTPGDEPPDKIGKQEQKMPPAHDETRPRTTSGVSSQRDWANKFMRKRRDSLMNTKVFPMLLKFQNLGRTTRSPRMYKDSTKFPHPSVFDRGFEHSQRAPLLIRPQSHTQIDQLFSAFATQIDDFSGPALLYKAGIAIVFSRLLIGGSSGEIFSFFWLFV